MEFIRGVLALLCLFFGHMAGRAAGATAKGRQPGRRMVTWIARMVLASGALLVRHEIDTLVIAVWALELALFGAGYWMVLNQKPPEDLTHEIFPE